MKNIFALTLALTSVVVIAQENEVATNSVITLGSHTYTRAELKEKIRRVQEKKHGGIIEEKGSAKGVFVILNSQDRITLDKIAEVEPTIDHWLRFRVKTVPAKTPVTMANIKAEIKAAKGTLGVAVVAAGDTLPALLPAPEDGWALVNVDKLAVGNPESDVLASRVRKEVLRGLAFVTGGAYLTKADPLMRDVRSVSDLDNLPVEQFGLEIITHLLETSSFYGITPANRATYKRACEEGWAPAPTNDIQQAVWDKVKAEQAQVPTKPLKIVPGMKPQGK